MHFYLVNIFFLGMFAMMFLYNLMQAFFQKERTTKAYLYYAAYIACWGIYLFLAWYEFYFVKGKYTYHQNVVFNARRSILPLLSYVAYFGFANEYIGLHKLMPGLWKWFRYTQIGLLGYCLLLAFVDYTFPLLNHSPAYVIPYTVVRFFMIVISLVGMVRVYQRKETLSFLFTLGSACLMVFSILAIISTYYWDNKSDFPLYTVPNFYLLLGITLELLCFSLGLSHLNKQIELEKSKAENLLREAHEKSYHEKTELELEKRRINQQITELRLKALRSQLNPHFLFNSLNAIQECVVMNQTDIATSYLAKFSKLMRSILENSDKQTITLAQEINLLKLYIDVESLRFSHTFSYEISSNTHIDPSLINIPPMLVQPYIENAIWHGLLPKKDNRKLKIGFSSDDDNLLILIEDNGIGRKKTAHAQTEVEQQSMGMKLTQERIEVFGEKYQYQSQIDIIDLTNPTGTRIHITVPLI